MDILLTDCNIYSSITYLWVTLVCWFLALGISSITTRFSNKKQTATKNTPAGEKVYSADIVQIILNDLWKIALEEYYAYKLMPPILILFLVMSLISFISQGFIFSNKYVVLYYQVFLFLGIVVVVRAYGFYSERNVWKFDEEKNSAVIIDKFILEKKAKIKTVIHYSDDSSWAFLSGKTDNESDGRTVALEEIGVFCKVFTVMAVLPSGFMAEKTGRKWIVKKTPDSASA